MINHIEGLTSAACDSTDEIKELLTLGKLNRQSPNSHLISTIHVKCYEVNKSS